MKKPMTTKQLLQKAKRILLKDGWCRFYLEDSHGRHCLHGALKKAEHGRCSYGDMTSRDALLVIEQCITKSPFAGDAMYFNDLVARDRRTIIRVLDKAIANA